MYVRRRDGEHMLFDLARDPLQNHNVARVRDYADLVRELNVVLRRLRRCGGSTCHVTLPPDLAVDAGEAARLGSAYWRAVNDAYGFRNGGLAARS